LLFQANLFASPGTYFLILLSGSRLRNFIKKSS
jgi:hypothetical protein